MADGRQKVADGEKLIYVRKGDISNTTTALVEGTNPNCRYLESSSDRLPNCGMANGTSPHTWGTNLRTITLHIPHISMSYILCDREMWVFVEFTTVHMQ